MSLFGLSGGSQCVKKSKQSPQGCYVANAEKSLQRAINIAITFLKMTIIAKTFAKSKKGQNELLMKRTLEHLQAYRQKKRNKSGLNAAVGGKNG